MRPALPHIDLFIGATIAVAKIFVRLTAGRTFTDNTVTCGLLKCREQQV